MLTLTGFYWQTCRRCRNRPIGSAKSRRSWLLIWLSCVTVWNRGWQPVHEGASTLLHSLLSTVCPRSRTVCLSGLSRLCADNTPNPRDCVSPFYCTLFSVVITCQCYIYFILFYMFLVMYHVYCICFLLVTRPHLIMRVYLSIGVTSVMDFSSRLYRSGIL